MWSCAVIVATDWWKNLASLITTLVSPVKLTELGKNPLLNDVVEVLCCDRRRLLHSFGWFQHFAIIALLSTHWLTVLSAGCGAISGTKLTTTDPSAIFDIRHHTCHHSVLVSSPWFHPTLQSFPLHHQGLYYQVRRRILCVTRSGH